MKDLVNVSNSKIKLRSGHDMPIIGIGTWQLTTQTAALVSKALKLGFRMIDTSGDYGTQPGVGDGIRMSELPREEIYLVTKVEATEDAYDSTRDDLEELEMTYANLMLLHRPPEQGVGVELWDGLIRAKHEGFTKDIGVSNYSIEQLEDLIDETSEVPAVNQIEWSPFGFSHEMLDYCRDNDIIIQAYSPLTRGQRLENDTLMDIADKYEKSPSQIILRWNLQLGVVPIVKAGKPDHLEENIEIFDFELDKKDMERIMDLNEFYSALRS